MSHPISHGKSKKHIRMFSPLLLEAPGQAWPGCNGIHGIYWRKSDKLIFGVPVKVGWKAEFWESQIQSLAYEGISAGNPIEFSMNFEDFSQFSLHICNSARVVGTLTKGDRRLPGWVKQLVRQCVPHGFHIAWFVAEWWTSVPYLEIGEGMLWWCIRWVQECVHKFFKLYYIW